jgi:hypothetical protein
MKPYPGAILLVLGDARACIQPSSAPPARSNRVRYPVQLQILVHVHQLHRNLFVKLILATLMEKSRQA